MKELENERGLIIQLNRKLMELTQLTQIEFQYFSPKK